MFTGIIEEVGAVTAINKKGSNIYFTLKASFSAELQVDQSVAHDGVCLTVTELLPDSFAVCAIDETLQRTSLDEWRVGSLVNLERAMKLGDRLDGHMVQGHVDTVARCTDRRELDGSWIFEFEYEPRSGHMTVPKGSVCVNGVSLTVVDCLADRFSVAIIPYTFEHTNFKNISKGDPVNLEFDVIGKYVARILEARN